MMKVEIITRLPQVLRRVLESPAPDRDWEERTLEMLKEEARRRHPLPMTSTLEGIRNYRTELAAEEAGVVAGFKQALDENRGPEFAEEYLNPKPQEAEQK